ncbi:recombinase family protein [Bradyrhizobium sp. CCGUVB1N3]
MHQVLTNPFYAGVYVYGRTQQSYSIRASNPKTHQTTRPRAVTGL